MKTVFNHHPGFQRLACIFLFVTAPVMAAAVESVQHGVLFAEQWELNRSGDRIVQTPALKELVNNWISRSADGRQIKIELQYPGGEEGELWVQELADWLVAMGIPSQYILMTPGSAEGDRIKLSLVKSH